MAVGDQVRASALYGWPVVCISVLCFHVVSEVVSHWGIPAKAQQSSNGVWRWKNTVVSLIHSSLTGCWAMYCLYDNPMMAKDMITTYSPMSLMLISLSVGYFVYDVIDMLRFNRSRQSYELILHHAVIFVCFGIAITLHTYVAYAIVALVIEVNNIFLHARQLMQILKLRRSAKLYRLNSLLNLGTYIVFRIGILAWMTRWLMINHALVPVQFYTVGSLGLATITVMNIILFYRLLCSDFIQPAKERQQ